MSSQLSSPTSLSEDPPDAPEMAGACGVGFFNICIGGVGTKAGGHLLTRNQSDAQRFPMILFHLDTDPGTTLATEDRVLIQLSGADVRAIAANPACFGPEATVIVQDLERMLAAGDIMNGSRTTRALTQLAFIFHRERLCRGLRRGLTRLREENNVAAVMPVLISSSGGGTGSAAQILLMDLLRQSEFRHRLLSGIPSDLLLPPMAFVAEPFAFANEAGYLQARKIMANALAFRLESEQMLAQRAVSYVAHIGYANEGGTVLADPDLMSKVLGHAVYEIERCWKEVKSRWVDGADDIASMTNYGGQDSPVFERQGDRWHVRRG